MSNSPDWDPTQYRPLLHLQVRLLRPDARFDRRFDSSDLVQETLLKAHKNRDRFRGTTEAERVRWLQEILRNVLADAVREATADKRDVRLEASLQNDLARSSACLEEYLSARGPSPSQQAERQELLLRLAAAVEELPPDQRDVVIQRDLQDESVRDIAARIGRTEKAVAGLLLRGRRKLAEILVDYR
jgi:RNA polymerase sigma-70 factor (ECF subfamily)